MSWVHTTHMRGEVEGHVLKIAAGPPDPASARTRKFPLVSVLLQTVGHCVLEVLGSGLHSGCVFWLQNR